MREIVDATSAPRTVDSLADDLARLGLKVGACVLAHCSLRSIGWVCGGPVAVIEALLRVVGETGTLVMPSHSGDFSDPAKWTSPPVPVAWLDTIYATMPAYDPARTPTRAMGAVAELFRTWPDVQRSRHPTSSFAAIGPQAARIVGDHALESPFGEASPLARLYELDADVLLLGVGLDKCTALHLAECRAWANAQLVWAGAPMVVDGTRRWVRYQTPPAYADAFPQIEPALAARGIMRQGKVGSAAAQAASLRQIVDTGTEWLASGVDWAGLDALVGPVDQDFDHAVGETSPEQQLPKLDAL